MGNKFAIFLLVIILFYSCGGTTDFIHESSSITVIEPEQLFADSFSTAIVSVNFGEGLRRNQEVTFKTSAGALFQMPYDLDATPTKSLTFSPFREGTELLLLANTLTFSEEVFISVTIDGFPIKTQTSFQPAYPEEMIVEATNRELTDGTNIEIIVNLIRKSGFSSDGLKFSIRDSVEVRDTSQTALITNVPKIAFSSANQVKFPLTFIQYSSGAQLRIFVKLQYPDGKELEESVLLYLN